MSTQYISVTFYVALKTYEEIHWVENTLKNPPEALRMSDMKKGKDFMLDFQWAILIDELWIYSDEGANTEQIAAFLTLYLQQSCCKHDALGFQYTYTGDIRKPADWGGGAIRLRKDPAFEGGVDRENFETNHFLEEWSIA